MSPGPRGSGTGPISRDGARVGGTGTLEPGSLGAGTRIRQAGLGRWTGDRDRAGGEQVWELV